MFRLDLAFLALNQILYFFPETSSNVTKPETFVPSTSTTNLTSPNTTAKSFTTQWNAIVTTNNETTTHNLSSTSLLTHGPTEPTTYNSTIFLITSMTENNNVMVRLD